MNTQITLYISFPQQFNIIKSYYLVNEHLHWNKLCRICTSQYTVLLEGSVNVFTVFRSGLRSTYEIITRNYTRRKLDIYIIGRVGILFWKRKKNNTYLLIIVSSLVCFQALMKKLGAEKNSIKNIYSMYFYK